MRRVALKAVVRWHTVDPLSVGDQVVKAEEFYFIGLRELSAARNAGSTIAVWSWLFQCA